MEEEKRAKPRKDHPGPEYFFKNLRIGELIVMDRWGEGHTEDTDCTDQGERLGGLGIEREKDEIWFNF